MSALSVICSPALQFYLLPDMISKNLVETEIKCSKQGVQQPEMPGEPGIVREFENGSKKSVTFEKTVQVMENQRTF